MRRIVLSIFLGLVIGIMGGLLIGWVIAPVQLINNPMRDLAQRYKDEYTVMVAIGYQIDGDLNEAINRLKPLGVSGTFNVPVYVRDTTERFISEEGTGRESDIRSLVELSCAMGAPYCTPPMERFRRPSLTNPRS
ncbi:MAG: hypothetical protein KF716_08970 [Anaerolineae bacterium]|nr:hypothetical protein [Anaerolineae bacterium]